jgi:salicylate hydroxylase
LVTTSASGRSDGLSPALPHLVAGSDPDTVNLVRVGSAAPVELWPTGPVTLLGDAIHNMTPMAGLGANTALRDADLLRRQPAAVHRGAVALPDAVHAYER